MRSLPKLVLCAVLLGGVLAPTLYGRTPHSRRPCSRQDSLGLLRVADPAWRDAQSFHTFLGQHGFVVFCVIRSTFASFLWSAPEAAFLTDHGDIEVRFFPAPVGAENVEVEEQRNNAGWRYSFPPHAGAGDTMFASRRQYFIKSRRWLIIVDDVVLATTLRKALALPDSAGKGTTPGTT